MGRAPRHAPTRSLAVRAPVAIGLAALLAAGGCGGDDDADTAVADVTDLAADQEPDGADDGGGGGDGDDESAIALPDGLPTADGLIPELAAIPLPDAEIAFEVGSAYDAEADPRETAVQALHIALAPEAVAEFYVTELPASGFTLEAANGGITDVSEIVVGGQHLVAFVGPDGLPGQLVIGPGAFAATMVNINLFRSGIR